MSWIRENEKKSWLQSCCSRVLKCGPVPRHLAFIMDGNRRFARKNSIEREKGHMMGFDKLAQTLEWCLDMGITEVTVYAFSIENFKRSKQEVDGLMELARQKFARLLEEKELINKHGVCIRVIGDISLLPTDLQRTVAEAMECSKHNTRATLNVCFAYTSRDEMCHAMREVTEGVQLGLIRPSDINEQVLEKCFYTSKSPDPDLLVRTSGEVRLSDFLLWQSSYSVLSFMPVLWPEFNIWNLYSAVLYYQVNYTAVQKAKEDHQNECIRVQREEDYQNVIEEVEREKLHGNHTATRINLEQRLRQYAAERETRVAQFLSHVNNKRDKFLQDLCSNVVPITSTV